MVRADSPTSSHSATSSPLNKLDDIKEETFYLDNGNSNTPLPDYQIVNELVAHLTRYRAKEKESRQTVMKDHPDFVPGFS